MRATDELNNIKTEFDPQEYFREYFKMMDIPEDAKEERQKAATDLFELFVFMFLLIGENQNRKAFNEQELLYQFQSRYADIIAEYGRNDAYFQEYLAAVPSEILGTTLRHLDSDYYLSDERAAVDAANEANSILNYEELQKKKDEGFTHKTWKAELDRDTRADHYLMNGKTIPIEDYFVFPDCEMLMPHDEVNGTAKQCANCRCSLKYSSQQNVVEKETIFGKIESSFKLFLNDNRGAVDIYNFGEAKALARQSNADLEQGIRSLTQRIKEHEYKISHPEEFWEKWDSFSEIEKKRKIQHWEKEIKGFNRSIENRESELLRRLQGK